MGSRDLRQMKTAAQNGKHGRPRVLGKEMFLGYSWMSPERVSVREEGEGNSMQRESALRVGNKHTAAWHAKLLLCYFGQLLTLTKFLASFSDYFSALWKRKQGSKSNVHNTVMNNQVYSATYLGTCVPHRHCGQPWGTLPWCDQPASGIAPRYVWHHTAQKAESCQADASRPGQIVWHWVPFQLISKTCLWMPLLCCSKGTFTKWFKFNGKIALEISGWSIILHSSRFWTKWSHRFLDSATFYTPPSSKQLKGADFEHKTANQSMH